MTIQQILLGYKPKPPEYEFLYESGDMGSGTSFSESVPLGSADASRVIVIALNSARFGNNSVTSISITGGTLLDNLYNQGNNIGAGLYAFAVPAGTSATVNITWSNNSLRTYLAVWSLKHFDSPSPIDKDASPAGGGASRDVDLNTQEGGLILGAWANGAGATLTNITQDFIQPDSGGNAGDLCGGSNFNLSTGTTTFTVNSCRAAVGMSFR